MSKKLKILVVEDTQVYQQQALEQLKNHNLSLASDYTTASHELFMNKHDLLLTDMFIPYGNSRVISQAQSDLHGFKLLVRESFRMYEADRFPKIKRGPIFRAMAACYPQFEQDPVTFMELAASKKIIRQDDERKILIDQIHERQDYARWRQHTAALEKMMAAQSHTPDLPWGLRLALETKIPVCVVTDLYHHDVAFEPLRFLFTERYGGKNIPYLDRLVNDQKPWTRAIQYAQDSCPRE